MSNMDNAVWRLLNFGTPLTVVAGTDGARGYYLIGNAIILNGWISVAVCFLSFHLLSLSLIIH
jgi:hypothetical protein